MLKKKKIIYTESKWRRLLSKEQFDVCRLKKTEKPFSGKYCFYKKSGLYVCICCGSKLFDSQQKLPARSGWPEFSEAFSEKSLEVSYCTDPHESTKIEVQCACCSAHLGYLFEDGPPPSYTRYVINSTSLKFQKKHFLSRWF